MDVQTGMRFPYRGSTGNRIPFWTHIPGHSFLKALVSETASHSEGKFRDVLSAEPVADALPCQVRLERWQGRLRIMATDLIDTLKLIRLATERRHLYRFARPHHKDLAGGLTTR